MKTKFFFASFLVLGLIALSSFSTANNSDPFSDVKVDGYYYFKFNHNKGYYTSIALCSGRSHFQILDANGHNVHDVHHYTTYGPYYSRHDAAHSLREVRRHYYYQTYRIGNLYCNDH